MKAVVAIVFIVAFIDFGNAFMCYNCAGTQSCNDPFSENGVLKIECSFLPGFENKCLKSVLPNGSASRSCSPEGTCSLIGGNGCKTDSSGTVCCCSGNLCNSASTTGISYVTFASLLIASFLGIM